ncbi:hypothetical protein J6590_091310, partial [Homalodisca vitripennis]
KPISGHCKIISVSPAHYPLIDDRVGWVVCHIFIYRPKTISDHFWLVYTFQQNPPLGTVKTDVSLKYGQPYGWHITNRKCRYYGVHGQFDRYSLMWDITVGVDGVCSLTSEVLPSLNKGVPPPAYFDWRVWFRSTPPLLPGRHDVEM